MDCAWSRQGDRMKRRLLLLWLLLPVPVIALHYGPGQRWLSLDDANALVRRARAAERDGKHPVAAACYLEAASKLGPRDETQTYRCEIAAARARARQGDAADALEKLDAVMASPRWSAQPEDVQAEARELLARTSYYAAWVMRLEGAARGDWSEAADESRQQFRLLAESKSADGQDRNLEAAVRLERMSLTELMAKPLPKEAQCMQGKNVSEKMCKRKSGKCNKPGNKPAKQPKDIRNDEQKAKGLSERTEGLGS